MCFRDWTGSKPTIHSYEPIFVELFSVVHTQSVILYTNLQTILKIGWATINLPPAGETPSGVREGRPAITLHISVHTID